MWAHNEEAVGEKETRRQTEGVLKKQQQSDLKTSVPLKTQSLFYERKEAISGEHKERRRSVETPSEC